MKRKTAFKGELGWFEYFLNEAKNALICFPTMAARKASSLSCNVIFFKSALATGSSDKLF